MGSADANNRRRESKRNVSRVVGGFDTPWSVGALGFAHQTLADDIAKHQFGRRKLFLNFLSY